MVMSAANWAELLTPQLTEAFYAGFTSGGRRSSMLGTFFRELNSERAFEEHLGVGQFGAEGWSFEKSGRVQYDERNKGFKTTFTHIEFAKGFMVRRRLIDDNLTSIAFDDANALGDTAFRKKEKSGANIFINAFTDSGVDTDGANIAGSDGVGLCSAAHPRSAVDATTQTNEGVLALTKDNLGTTRRLMGEFSDDRGDLLDVVPDLLLVPPELEDDALVIAKSTLDPTSANNAVNAQAGRFQNVVWHYLTDATAWFMLDSGRMKQDLIWYNRIPLEFAQEPDFDTFITKYRAYMRYSRGFRDWRWIYGQNG